MDQILQGIEGVCCYLDDILISAPSEQSHSKILSEVLKRLGRYDVRVKSQKCEWGKHSVEYLGHVVDAEGIHPTTEKLEAISEAPSPTNVTELRSFLRLLNYYGKFIPNASTVLHPLNELLRKEIPWKWTEDCEKAYKASKSQLMESTLLVHYDVNRELRLACDASAYGSGAVISHVMPDGQERPVAFASRTLSASERNYAQIEREALSLIYGVKKFHKYLIGRKFTLITDHKPLTTIFNPESAIHTLAAARMQRWAIILSAYTYDIEFKRSGDHGNADALSRLPRKVDHTTHEEVKYFSYLDELPVTAKDISRATLKDPVLARVHEFVANGWPNYVQDEDVRPFFTRRDELTVEQGCILWGLRVIIPPKFRSRLLDDLHEQHLGICRMKGLARSYLWWPGLDKDIECLVNACTTCLSVRNAPPRHP